MPDQLTVRVFYPRTSGRIVLRTDMDWGSNVEADSVSADGTVAAFTFHTDPAYFYFKPCLVDDAGVHWSQGTNYLAILGAADHQDVYPFFFGDLKGTISDPIQVPSQISPLAHTIRVYQPPGYAENTLKHYPVLYMHDGKNLFFPDEAFSGAAWDVEGTMDVLDAMNIIDKVIVVGVYANDRETEYTQPGYEIYGRFLVQELKPLVDHTYRTLPDAPNTGVMGSSLGGVVSLYLAWQWPEVFGKTGCLSSTFSWRDNLMDRVGQEPRRTIQIYLDSGWPDDNYDVTIVMRDLLLLRGYQFGTDLLHFAFPLALHNEKYWAMRIHIPFQFFYGRIPHFPG